MKLWMWSRRTIHYTPGALYVLFHYLQCYVWRLTILSTYFKFVLWSWQVSLFFGSQIFCYQFWLCFWQIFEAENFCIILSNAFFAWNNSSSCIFYIVMHYFILWGCKQIITLQQMGLTSVLCEFLTCLTNFSVSFPIICFH